MRRVVGLCFLVAGILAAFLAGQLVRRHVVQEGAMLRAYEPGDRLVVEALTYRMRPPRIGEAVLVRQPGNSDPVVRRIAAGPGAEVTVAGATDFLGLDEWYVLGDNLDESVDSRELGPVRTEDILGRVWRRY